MDRMGQSYFAMGSITLKLLDQMSLILTLNYQLTL